MEDILPRMRSWIERGEPVALATIVEVERKAPRGPGAAMAISARREIAGSLSGGCVEPALVEEARGVLDQGASRLVSFGISDDQALGVGLSCGGTIHVWLERVGPSVETLDALAAAVAANQAVALVTILAAGDRGKKILVFENGSRVVGSTGDATLDREVADAARVVLAAGGAERQTIGGVDVFMQSFFPAPVLHVVGAVHPAAELCQAGKLLGFRVVVCDPRSPFATVERLPSADEIVREWPDAYLSRQALGPRDAVCILTHDVKFDVPALRVALASSAGYVGAMGSRRTHARRVERLREEGVSEESMARVAAPIGLDIGAESPAEIAIAIVADIVARRRKRLDRGIRSA
ncbi:MAG TPA: XdhC/CoxI family protein [Candidatus Binatia bacterium]|nr:XdhC/CoxI family protein [Candidatus Binatia bacterium]